MCTTSPSRRDRPRSRQCGTATPRLSATTSSRPRRAPCCSPGPRRRRGSTARSSGSRSPTRERSWAASRASLGSWRPCAGARTAGSCFCGTATTALLLSLSVSRGPSQRRRCGQAAAPGAAPAVARGRRRGRRAAAGAAAERHVQQRLLPRRRDRLRLCERVLVAHGHRARRENRRASARAASGRRDGPGSRWGGYGDIAAELRVHPLRFRQRS